VIAIENTRLFNETREALEHQTATSEVLQVISSSMADPQPVFERILDCTERLFDVRTAAVFIAPGDGLLHLAARRGIASPRLTPSIRCRWNKRQATTSSASGGKCIFPT
jgi:hypothetical protein